MFFLIPLLLFSNIFAETKSTRSLYEPPYLFQLPTTDVLNAFDLHFAGGGAYRISATGGLLANIGLGLGGVGTLTIDTQDFLNNLSNRVNTTQTASLKFLLLQERKSFPAITVEFQTTANITGTPPKQTVPIGVQSRIEFGTGLLNPFSSGAINVTPTKTLIISILQQSQISGQDVPI